MEPHPPAPVEQREAVCVDILSVDADEDGCVGHFVSVELDEEENVKEEKRGKSSAKKPPRPPPQKQRAYSLDGAAAAAALDHQRLMKELAMMKRARIERMRGLLLQKKLAASKPTSSHSSSLFAMIFTIFVFVVVLFQGMSCEISCGTFQESSAAGIHHQEPHPSAAAHDSV